MFLCLGDPVTIPWELLDEYSFRLVDILTSVPSHGLHPLPPSSPAWNIPFRSGMLRCFFFRSANPTTNRWYPLSVRHQACSDVLIYQHLGSLLKMWTDCLSRLVPPGTQLSLYVAS